ncbi:MAG: PIN domain-containing protein [Candidatus Micrarchaeota archaeon]
MMLLDSSHLIALLNEEDVFHEEALRKMDGLEKSGRGLAISDYILNEAVTVILRKRGLEKAKETLDFLLDYKQLEIFHMDEKGFAEVVKEFREQKDHLSFVDCSILWMAKRHGFGVLTFDKNLLAELGKTGKKG